MFLKNLPIKFSDDNALNQRIATNSTRMLELRRRLGEAVLLADTEKESLYRAVQETDRAIDELVYDLYGLTAEERRLVEGEVEQR